MDAGTGRQRFSDGTLKVRRYGVGDTEFSEHSIDDAQVHDLENAGETILRFVAVELIG